MEINKTIEFIKKEEIIVISDVEKEVRKLIDDLYSDDGYKNKSIIFELINICFNPDSKEAKDFSVNATSEDYFNLSLILAKENFYDLACLVLEAGINNFPKDIDLIAYFLRCGICSSEYRSQCTKYYDVLLGIPKEKWTWRAYDFSIDYLRICQKTENDENSEKDKEIVNLLEEFKKRFELESDRPYLAYAEYYHSIQQFDQELKMLEIAVNKKDNLSRCSFRLAEIYIRKGKFKFAMELLDKCKKYVCMPDSGLDPGSIYIHSALCRMAVYYDDKSLNEENKIALAREVFNDYKAALVSNARNSQLFRKLSTLKDIFSENSGVPSSD
jgi:tetratricopeptide (TPR) repeat protein